MPSNRRYKRRSKNPTPKWMSIALVGVLAVLAGTITLIALDPRGVNAPQAAGTVPTSTYSPGEQVASQPVTESPVTVFIGDSYTHGTGASSEATRWTDLVSTAKGWQEVNLGRGGTGYVTTSSTNGCGRDSCPNYGEMLGSAQNASPDKIVISGGQNDFGLWQTDPAAETAAINSVLAAYRAAFPDAEIVVVGPSSPAGVGDTVTGMDQAVQAAAATISATYISLIDPPVIDPSMVTEDGGHVNDAGHAAIAQRIIDSLS